jgi:hypothetical protein
VGDEYGIYYRPEVAVARVSSARFTMIWRLGSLLLSALIIGLVWLIWPGQVGNAAPWFLIASVGIGLTTSVIAAISWARAAGDAKFANGLAIGLNREGVLIGQRWITWPEVGSMVVRPGSLGSSNALVATMRDNSTLKVPLELTDAMPASLDAVVRVLSGGRTWVDLSRLD